MYSLIYSLYIDSIVKKNQAEVKWALLCYNALRQFALYTNHSTAFQFSGQLSPTSLP